MKRVIEVQISLSLKSYYREISLRNGKYLLERFFYFWENPHDGTNYVDKSETLGHLCGCLFNIINLFEPIT